MARVKEKGHDTEVNKSQCSRVSGMVSRFKCNLHAPGTELEYGTPK